MPIAQRVAGFGTTIFTEINERAAQHGAVNLGQGAPDFASPPHVIAAARRAIETPRHQYAPGWGYAETRQAVARHAERFYGIQPDPQREVLITNGATEAIFATMMGLINPGDEVILIEPFYDSYLPSLLMAGGLPRFVPLHAPDWHFDRDELASLFNPRTRAIVLNTPHNPTGKVFSSDEMMFIAQLCQEHDVLVITDEVYEHILYDDARHVRMASLPAMADRTLTISSIGKSFTITGWKIGWVLGNADLLTGIWRARQFISFAVASPLQWAAAEILATPDSYFAELKTLYSAKRDLLLDALQATPLIPLQPQGGYFIMVDTSALGQPDDRAFAEFLIQEIGVACIPPSAFYAPEHQHLAARLARFSLCKTDETLLAAAERLQKLAR